MSPTALTGLVVAVVALALSAAFGLARRSRDGRMRAEPVRGDAGRAEPVRGDAGRAEPVRGDAGESWPARLGARPGVVTLLQFSTKVCGPCRAASRRCTEVVGEVDGVRHVEVDAADHLGAVRALGIWRTPTILVVDSTGRIVGRIDGVPRPAQLRDVLATLVAVQR